MQADAELEAMYEDLRATAEAEANAKAMIRNAESEELNNLLAEMGNSADALAVEEELLTPEIEPVEEAAPMGRGASTSNVFSPDIYMRRQPSSGAARNPPRTN